MQRGGLDPRQVPLAGHEAKCLKIIKDVQPIGTVSLVAEDAGFESAATYRQIIPHPISLASVADKVTGKGASGIKYTYLNDFALDFRRIVGNFYRFNYFADALTAKNRKEVVKILFKFEQCWQSLIAELEVTRPGMYYRQPLPELKWALAAFEDSVKTKDDSGMFLIDSFILPIHLCITDPAELKAYKKVVKRPISFGEIISNIAEAAYDSLDQLKDDVDTMVSNCSTYWSGLDKGDLGQVLIKGAIKLQGVFLKSLGASEKAWQAKQSGPLSLMPHYIPGSVAPTPAPAAAPVAPVTLTLSKGGAKGKTAAAATAVAPAPVPAPAPVLTLSAPKTKPAARGISAPAAVPAPAPVPVAASASAVSLAAVSMDAAIPGGGILPERPAWQLGAEEVWKALKRHAYVDPSKSTVIADFWRPVAMVDPLVAADYLSVIAQPMDLTTLINDLTAGAIASPQQFTDLAVTIFQNAIDYNSRHEDSSYAVHLSQRCAVLKRYTYWLCLENLPIEDEPASSSSKAKVSASSSTVGCPLSRAAQEEQRKLRDTLLSEWYIQDTGGSPYTECNKLLKDLQRGRNKAEYIQIGYFQEPVNVKAISDYSVYVRNPADLSTIKYRLDGTLPSALRVADLIDKTVKRYAKFGEFVADLRRVFSNALKYNGAHLASDTTGITRAVYDAAKMLQERLEGLLGPFTMNLAERIDRAKLTNAENQQRQAELRAKLEKEEAEAKKFEQLVLEELKATDHVFAADHDLEQKRKLTELQLKEHILQQQRAMLEANNAVSAATMEDLGRDIAQDDTSTGGAPGQMAPLTAAAAGALFGAGMHMNNNLMRGMQVAPLPGFGAAGKVPARYAHLVELKKSVRGRAWAYWLAAPGTVTQNTRAAGSKSVASSKSGKRDSGTIRITSTARTASSSSTAAGDGASGTAAASSASAQAAEDCGARMDVENTSADVNIIPASADSNVAGGSGESAVHAPQKVKTSFTLGGAARKKICTQRARNFSFRSVSGSDMDVSDDDV